MTIDLPDATPGRPAPSMRTGRARPPHRVLYQAVRHRDPWNDGVFWVCVRSTGIFCRPSCPSRSPRPENVTFFDSVAEAERQGFRPCKRCRPTTGAWTSPEWLPETFLSLLAPPDGFVPEVEVVVSRVSTPLGIMVAGATDEGIGLLEFSDRRMLATQIGRLRRRLRCAFRPGESSLTAALRSELQEYFEGRRRAFDVPLVLPGSVFQRLVWGELRAIPYGETLSYRQLAARVGRPGAVRATGRANGDNRVAILVPCHRVIGADGALRGYGGKLWRKRRLLEMEGAMRPSAAQAALPYAPDSTASSQSVRSPRFTAR